MNVVPHRGAHAHIRTPAMSSRWPRTSAFTRHFGEMMAAMMAGMIAYGAIAGTALAAAGTNADKVRLSQPEPAVLGMATSMTIPMVAWMRHRSHTWQSSAEMSAAMFAVPIVLIVCYWLGGVSANPICPVACGLMIPSMLIAMLLRLDTYTTHVHGLVPVARSDAASG